MPLIVNFVEKYFGKKPITSFNHDESVAIGAALRGETLFNNSPYLDTLHLIDVIPLNIGIMEGEDNKFDVILKRNTYIPCRNKKIYNPIEDYQKAVGIKIYEGTNKFAQDNTLLGEFILEIVPKKKNDSKIEVSFLIDEHLILHVSAEQISEGKSKAVSIKKKNHLLTTEELEMEIKKVKEAIRVDMNENEKAKYSKIIDKQKDFFSQKKVTKYSEKDLYDYIQLIEDYISEFKIKENNIHFMIILFRLYNILVLEKKSTFDLLEEKIDKYLYQISEVDIFYVLNFISKYDLEKSFQKNLTVQISLLFSQQGMNYLTDNFDENKNIAFELFQLSIKLIDNLFVQNNELKNDHQILDIIEYNEKYLRFIKISDLSMKIKDLYNHNQDNKKYLNQIIELYQTIANLIKNKDEIEYIKDFEILYKLGDNYNYLLSVLEIMNAFNAFIQFIEQEDNIIVMNQKREFTQKLRELKKYYEESKNVNMEYFKNDYNDNKYNKVQEEINNKYNEDKSNNELTDFAHYILENHPPITFPKSIDDFKKSPSLKVLVASYSKTFTKKYPLLKNKDKIREKIHTLVSEMFNNNVELKAINDNGNDTDGEDNNDNESLMTNYTIKTK